MKHFLRLLLFLCLPLLLAACEEGAFGPRQLSCLETRQTSDTGSSIDKVYNNDKRITELHNVQNGEVRSYYLFTYGSDGRISESKFFDAVNSTELEPERITYNASGKWLKTTRTTAAGNTAIFEAEYNSQGQIQKLTSRTERAGAVTENYTINYEWMGGNNTVYTLVSPTIRRVIRYEFDMELENKRRQEQEKLAFFYASVGFNKNMYKRVTTTSTDLATNNTTETRTDYSYQLNENGYPVELTRTITTGTGTPSTATTYFEYSCD